VILLFSLIAASAPNLRATETPPARFAPGRILVQPRRGLAEKDFEAKLRRHGGQQRDVIRDSNVRVIHVPEVNAPAILAALNNDPAIEFAERDYIAEAAAVPNDPYVQSGREWHLAKIQSLDAWNVTSGATNVVVAVLDSGVNAAHPDLAGQLLPGFDFVGGDADPADDFGHGTAVAGVISATANNAAGVAGVAFGSRVLPVKVMDANGFAYYSTIAQGIYYAVAQGARVINISIAGTSPSATLQNAVNWAWSNNVVVVAAAGNNGNDVPYYPAACSNAVAVAATTANDALASFSSYGGHLALAAPGETIWTTVRDVATGYAPWNGTSFASPVVAGVAALVFSAQPALTGGQVVSILKQTADDLGAPGFDPWFGFGRVNALRAVTAAVNFDPTPAVNVLSPTPGTGVSGQVAVEVTATASSPVARLECYVNGQLLGTNGGPSATFSWTTAGLPNGTYTLQARAVDTLGNVGYSQGVPVTVANAPAAPTTITGWARTTDGSLRLTWTAIPSRTYRVQFTTNLRNPNWQNLGPDVTATDDRASLTVQPGAPQGFFRVQSLP
jgi:thermitase